MSVGKTFEYTESSYSAWFWDVDHKLFEFFGFIYFQSDLWILDMYNRLDLRFLDKFFLKVLGIYLNMEIRGIVILCNTQCY